MALRQLHPPIGTAKDSLVGPTSDIARPLLPFFFKAERRSITVGLWLVAQFLKADELRPTSSRLFVSILLFRFNLAIMGSLGEHASRWSDPHLHEHPSHDLGDSKRHDFFAPLRRTDLGRVLLGVD